MMLFILSMLLSGLFAEVTDIASAILLITGSDSVEEISVDAYESFLHLAEHPLDINNCARSRIMSCPLFTPFQAASIIERRTRSGDILSFAELALVDGFNAHICEALRYFLVLHSSSPPGAAESRRANASLTLRSTVQCSREGNADFESSGNWAAKLNAEYASLAELNCTFRQAAVPRTLSLALHSPDGRWSVFLGDQQARFGQGLLLWSGFSMSGFASAQTFKRNGSGLSASSSAGRNIHGIGAQYEDLRNRVSLLYSQQGIIALAYRYLTRTSSWGASLSGSLGKSYSLSADFRAGLPDLSISGECVLQLRAPGALRSAACVSAVWTPRYGTSLSSLIRWYQTDYDSRTASSPAAFSSHNDEAGLALLYNDGRLSASLDIASRLSAHLPQCKGIVSYSHDWRPSPSSTLEASLRSSTRYRPSDFHPLREDLRADLSFASGKYKLSSRANLLWCKDLAMLFHLEPGWVGEKFSAYLRCTYFDVANWEDRIYCYERSLPGTFSVPAYYGRGWKLSVTAGLRIKKRRTAHKMNLRAAVSQYYRSERSVKSELKLQYQFFFL